MTGARQLAFSVWGGRDQRRACWGEVQRRGVGPNGQGDGGFGWEDGPAPIWFRRDHTGERGGLLMKEGPGIGLGKAANQVGRKPQ